MDYFNPDICKRKNMLISEEKSLEWVLATWAATGDTSIKNYAATAFSGGVGVDSVF